MLICRPPDPTGCGPMAAPVEPILEVPELGEDLAEENEEDDVMSELRNEACFHQAVTRDDSMGEQFLSKIRNLLAGSELADENEISPYMPTKDIEGLEDLCRVATTARTSYDELVISLQCQNAEKLAVSQTSDEEKSGGPEAAGGPELSSASAPSYGLGRACGSSEPQAPTELHRGAQTALRLSGELAGALAGFAIRLDRMERQASANLGEMHGFRNHVEIKVDHYLQHAEDERKSTSKVISESLKMESEVRDAQVRNVYEGMKMLTETVEDARRASEADQARSQMHLNDVNNILEKFSSQLATAMIIDPAKMSFSEKENSEPAAMLSKEELHRSPSGRAASPAQVAVPNVRVTHAFEAVGRRLLRHGEGSLPVEANAGSAGVEGVEVSQSMRDQLALRDALSASGRRQPMFNNPWWQKLPVNCPRGSSPAGHNVGIGPRSPSPVPVNPASFGPTPWRANSPPRSCTPPRNLGPPRSLVRNRLGSSELVNGPASPSSVVGGLASRCQAYGIVNRQGSTEGGSYANARMQSLVDVPGVTRQASTTSTEPGSYSLPGFGQAMESPMQVGRSMNLPMGGLQRQPSPRGLCHTPRSLPNATAQFAHGPHRQGGSATFPVARGFR